jgi:hypothetical protein
MMRKLFLFSTVMALAPSLGAQVPASRPSATVAPRAGISVDRVVAIVGDQPLLWSDVLALINQQRAAGVQIPADSAGQ